MASYSPPIDSSGRRALVQRAEDFFEKILGSGLNVGLPGPAPWQAPQSADREDGGEEPEHADREQRPDEKEVSAGIGEPAGDADALPPHVDVGDDQRKERQKEHDDVPRSPFGKHQRSVQPDDGEGHHHNEVCEPSRLPPVHDVSRQVKRKKEKQEQRRDG